MILVRPENPQAFPPMSNTTPSAGGQEWHLLESATSFSSEKYKGLIEESLGRIDTVRRRALSLRLCDRSGKPLAHRKIRLRQVKSDFLWGFAGAGLIDVCHNPQKLTDDVVKRNLLYMARLFNSVNLLNYWNEWTWKETPKGEEFFGYQNYDTLDRAVQWANGHGLVSKIHPLWWGVPKAIPAWMDRFDQSKREMFREVRLRQIAARFKGRIGVYDAVNEALWEPSLAQTASRHWPHNTPIPELVRDISQVLAIVRDEDPSTTLVVNDYGVQVGDLTPIPVPCSDGTTINRDIQARRYRELMLALKAAGAAPDAVGIQAFHALGKLEQQIATYDLMAETGIPIHITEFQSGGSQASDLVKAGAPRAEIIDRIAEYADASIVLAFGHPGIEAFFFWYDLEYLFDLRGLPSAWYKRLQKRLHQDWRTDEVLTTDADGCLKTRAFTGSYHVSFEESGVSPMGVDFAIPAASRGEIALNLAL
jgi:GH35 family endo-1,4-beta-xylanase